MGIIYYKFGVGGGSIQCVSPTVAYSSICIGVVWFLSSVSSVLVLYTSD